MTNKPIFFDDEKVILKARQAKQFIISPEDYEFVTQSGTEWFVKHKRVVDCNRNYLSEILFPGKVPLDNNWTNLVRENMDIGFVSPSTRLKEINILYEKLSGKPAPDVDPNYWLPSDLNQALKILTKLWEKQDK